MAVAIDELDFITLRYNKLLIIRYFVDNFSNFLVTISRTAMCVRSGATIQAYYFQNLITLSHFHAFFSSPPIFPPCHFDVMQMRSFLYKDKTYFICTTDVRNIIFYWYMYSELYSVVTPPMFALSGHKTTAGIQPKFAIAQLEIQLING